VYKTVRKLGRKGRFGNQLFQYARLRQEAGDRYQCGVWAGQELFGLNDPPVRPGVKDIGTNFPYDSGWYDKDLFQSVLHMVPNAALDRVIEHAKQDGPVVGVHLRRGDYGTFKRRSARWCFRAPTEWYVQWLDANLHRMDGTPTVLIASDDPTEQIPTYQTFKTDGTVLSDFYALTKCDYLLISNSTFSFAASMLASDCQECWRPRLSLKKLVKYDPWDSPVVFKDELYESNCSIDNLVTH